MSPPPFYYDLNQTFTSSGTAGTPVTNLWGKTVASQETVSIVGLYLAARFGTAGGAQARMAHNTGTSASLGTSQVPSARNLRGNPAAQSLWSNGGTVISPGSALVVRMTVGFAQTGGMGGWIPITPQDAIQMMPGATNPVDFEVNNLASSSTVAGDLTLEIGEGV